MACTDCALLNDDKQVHHTRHHQTYVSNLNGVLTGEHGSAIEVSGALRPRSQSVTYSSSKHSTAKDAANQGTIGVAWQGMSLAEMQARVSTLPDAIRTTVTNHGGGHYNHCLFFSTLRAAGSGAVGPADDLRTAVEAKYGGTEGMRTALNAAAMKVFGSGWAWLGVDAAGELATCWTRNQENPLMRGVVDTPMTPIMGLDVWEHAMYLKYLNRRPEYIDAFWHLVDWEQVSQNFAAVREGGTAVFDVPTEE